jgi:serine/threonine-protein kinase
VFEDTDGTPVMVMELLKGEPLSAYRERVGAMTLHEAATILVPAVQALRAAHQKGIVHRDLKPDNVFLATTPAGRVTKLLDFGIAKVLDPTKLSSETQGQQTNTGSILGTPHYMSYEQAMSDKQIDHRTDIWSMGVMLFEALTGRRPLAFDTLGQMYVAFLQGSVPQIRGVVPGLPSDIADVIDKCLKKQQADRLGDLQPLIDTLSRYLDASVPGADAGGRVVDAAALPLAAERGSTHSPLSSSVSTQAPAKRASRGRVVVVAIAAAVVAAGAMVIVRSMREAPSTNATQAASVTNAPSATNAPSTPSTPSPSTESATASASAAPSAPPSASTIASGGARTARPMGSAPGAESVQPKGAASAPIKPLASGAASATKEQPKKGIAEQLPY